MKKLNPIVTTICIISLIFMLFACNKNNRIVKHLISKSWICTDKDTTGIPPKKFTICINFNKLDANSGTYSKVIIVDTVSYSEKGNWVFNKDLSLLLTNANKKITSNEQYLIIPQPNDKLIDKITFHLQNGGILIFKDTTGIPPLPNPQPGIFNLNGLFERKTL
jgi:hypothetical protein